MAIPYYEALEKKNPEHHWVGINLWLSYARSNRRREGSELARRALKARPNDPRSHLLVAGDSLCPPYEDPDLVVSHAEKGHALRLEQGDSSRREAHSASLIAFRMDAAWARGDVRKFKQGIEARGLQRTLTSPRDLRNSAFYILKAYVALGALRRAFDLASSHQVPEDPVSRKMQELRLAVYSDDRETIARFVTSADRLPARAQTAIWLLKAGEKDAAEQTFRRLRHDELGTSPESVEIALGVQEVAQGQFTAAAARLNSALESIHWSHPIRLYAVHALAKAYAANGRTRDAISLLEHATGSGRACGSLAPVLTWFDARSELISLYIAAGRAADARKVRELPAA